ncbi:LPS export ABC transporter periplasmic protein LptC [Saccharicrinis sp. FJH62]|uniref:LPS export ABC transporter periplasmic protein LptC n=1 Tax=Saccharicrinis sp. FJH62 TaxID=3344657 RepID=UPI0035D502CF
MLRYKIHIKKSVIAALIFCAAIIFSGCTKSKTQLIPEIDRSKWPSVKAINIESIVSDSGYVKYIITAPLYEVFDKVEEPYWEFSKGLKLKRYNHDQVVDSEIECNYARYLEKEKLWRLENKVFARNIDDETFETELMYWDQEKEKLYTDQMLRITNHKTGQVVICTGFESNQNFTQYSFEKVTATFLIDIE